MAGNNGDPYPISIARNQSVIVILNIEGPSGINLNHATICTALRIQNPLLNLPATTDERGAETVEIVYKKIEVWGPTAGQVVLYPYKYNSYQITAATLATQPNVQLNNRPRKSMIDTGTATKRPFLSYVWQEEETQTSGVNYYSGPDNFLGNISIASITMSSGTAPTLFGTYGVVYLHLDVITGLGAAVAPPTAMNFEFERYRNIAMGKRKLEEEWADFEWTQNKLFKVAKLKALTPPEGLKE